MMVTFIATLIHIFSIGYMSDELQETVEDHPVHTAARSLPPPRAVRPVLHVPVAVLLLDAQPWCWPTTCSRCSINAGNWSAFARICWSASISSGKARPTRPTRRSSRTASAATPGSSSGCSSSGRPSALSTSKTSSAWSASPTLPRRAGAGWCWAVQFLRGRSRPTAERRSDSIWARSRTGRSAPARWPCCSRASSTAAASRASGRTTSKP